MFKLSDMKKFLIIFVILLITIYFIILPYYQNYQQEQSCQREPRNCPFNLSETWAKVGCIDPIENSLVYRIHILRDNNGLLANFTCEVGSAYSRTQRGPYILGLLKNCSRDTIELVDLAIRQRNNTETPLVLVPLSYAYNFSDYNYTVLLCNQTHNYTFLSLVNYFELAYP
jgi:hypothetical protein